MIQMELFMCYLFLIYVYIKIINNTIFGFRINSIHGSSQYVMRTVVANNTF